MIPFPLTSSTVPHCSTIRSNEDTKPGAASPSHIRSICSAWTRMAGSMERAPFRTCSTDATSTTCVGCCCCCCCCCIAAESCIVCQVYLAGASITPSPGLVIELKHKLAKCFILERPLFRGSCGSVTSGFRLAGFTGFSFYDHRNNILLSKSILCSAATHQIQC